MLYNWNKQKLWEQKAACRLQSQNKKKVFSNIKRKEIEKEKKERKKLLFNFGGFRRLDFTYNKQHSSSSEEHNKNFILHFTKDVFFSRIVVIDQIPLSKFRPKQTKKPRAEKPILT